MCYTPFSQISALAFRSIKSSGRGAKKRTSKWVLTKSLFFPPNHCEKDTLYIKSDFEKIKSQFEKINSDFEKIKSDFENIYIYIFRR